MIDNSRAFINYDARFDPPDYDIREEDIDGVIVSPLFEQESDGEIPETPKQLELRVISADLVMRLNEHWHSVLPVTEKGNLNRNTRKVFYGFEHSNRWWAAAIWTDPVAANRLEGGPFLELRRFAISNYAPRNTATYLLGQMRRDLKSRFPDVVKLISYQDTGIHTGTIYKADNWTIGNRQEKHQSWTNRKRVADQSTAPKIRWEHSI